MRSILVWAGVLMALAGCATQSAATVAPRTSGAADYYPLAVGNRWTYALTGPDGKVVDTKTVTILRREGEFFVDDQGGRLTVDAYGVRDDKRYLLKEPIQAGTKWTNVVSVSATERYTVTAAGEECDIPAGNRAPCVVVEGRTRITGERYLINEMTFARGVGILRIRTALEDGGVRRPQLNINLSGFALAPPGAAEVPK